MDKQSSGSEGTSKEPETRAIIRPQDESFTSGPTQTSVEIGTLRWQWMIQHGTLEVRIHHLGDPDRGSLLQTEIALSSCESEYVCLSQAARKAIPIIELVQEMKQMVSSWTLADGQVQALRRQLGSHDTAKSPAMRPRTKHINVKSSF
jgi:hypothetical protein